MTVTGFPLTSDPPFSFTSTIMDFGMCDYSSPSYEDDSDDEDEDEHNRRVTPHWQSYRYLFESRGYRLDTYKDVRQFYLRYWETRNIKRSIESCAGYKRACREGRDDDELCKDEGLPERLFRGKRLADNHPIVIKAVHRRSRELDVITALSTPPLKDHPMNHCIPVLDIINVPPDFPNTLPHAVFQHQLSFIVMEEWSSEFIPPNQPHTLQSFLNSLRHCIQHITFMHNHCFSHLDIGLRNVLTDYAGRYAYIDYEMSRRFCQPPVEVEEGGDPRLSVMIYQPRAAEPPPEVEKGHSTSPYAMDVWALGVLILKAGISAGYDVPELRWLIEGMLEPQWERRPSAKVALRRFEEAISKIPEERLQSVSHTSLALPTGSSYY